MKATWLSAFGLALDLGGRLRQAVEVGKAALAVYAEGDPFGLEAQTRGLLAFAHGQMGGDEEDQTLGRLELTVQAPRLAVSVDRGRAWSSVARGTVEDGVRIVVAGGSEADGYGRPLARRRGMGTGGRTARAGRSFGVGSQGDGSVDGSGATL